MPIKTSWTRLNSYSMHYILLRMQKSSNFHQLNILFFSENFETRTSGTWETEEWQEAPCAAASLREEPEPANSNETELFWPKHFAASTALTHEVLTAPPSCSPKTKVFSYLQIHHSEIIALKDNIHVMIPIETKIYFPESVFLFTHKLDHLFIESDIFLIKTQNWLFNYIVFM